MAELRTYSVLLNWDDDDSEQGTFGALVRAEDDARAEVVARAVMRANHIENHCDSMDDEDVADSCSYYEDRSGVFGGSVVDLSEGAIWHAAKLEAALRDLLNQVDEYARLNGWPDNDPRERARTVIAAIDAEAAMGDFA